MNIIEFVKNNLSHAGPIVILGAFALAIGLERFYALCFAYPMGNMAGFFERLRGLVLSDRLGEAMALCERYDSKLIARVAKCGFEQAQQTESLIVHALDIARADATDKIQKRTAYLATIANVSTLLGLFGTILGLIQSFDAIGNATAQQRSALLAAGISTAMNATMLGLAIAIPAMIAYSFLANRTNKLLGDIDQAVIRTQQIIEQRFYAQEAPKGLKKVI